MILKRSIFVSIVSHMALLSLFSLSFGKIIPPAQFQGVSFLGQLFYASQVNPPESFPQQDLSGVTAPGVVTKGNPGMFLPKGLSGGIPFGTEYYFKPALSLAVYDGKESYIVKAAQEEPPLSRKEQTVILHPMLPYSFPLYFKDRQVAHVELMFKIAPAGLRNSVFIKRKISSGNLEVDLLSMRHIGHYLFIQQKSFVPNDWQVVKIDLSAQRPK